MTIPHLLARALLLAPACAASLTAHATSVHTRGTGPTALQARDVEGTLSNGPGALYDTTPDTTGLDDADFIRTGADHPDPAMDRMSAVEWASGLNFKGITGSRRSGSVDGGGHGCRDFSFSGGTDRGYNEDLSTSGLAPHMRFVTPGNKGRLEAGAGSPCRSGDLADTGPFRNLQPLTHRTRQRITSPCTTPADHEARCIDYNTGHQFNFGVPYGNAAWTVRPGNALNVDPPAEPEPGDTAIFLAGLVMLGMVARRR